MRFLWAAWALLLVFAGCQRATTDIDGATEDRRVTPLQTHNLGWMGSRSRPLSHSVSLADPDNPDRDVVPGGIRIVDVIPGLPFSAAGIEAGDLIVQVGKDWLPIKDDPTLDFIKAIEDQIDARKDQVELGLLRNGQFQEAILKLDLPSLDEGLPLASVRLRQMSAASLNRLVDHQTPDGSFGGDTDDDLMVLTSTSLAGLALMSADEPHANDFSATIQRCLDFVGGKLDGILGQQDGVARLDPLTAALVGLLLAESEVSLSEEIWLDRFSLIIDTFERTQHECGGWGVLELPAENKASTANGPEFEPESPDPTPPDIRATFTTNLVLLAIGAIERKGLSIDQVIIENGCRWLNQQMGLTVASSLDRRTKAVLNAGAVAALVALNCDRNDQRLTEYFKNMMERAHDVYTAPQLGEMGMFLTALSARQLGNRSWLPFHQAAKYLEVSLQSPDGSYVRFPGVAREPLELESAFDNDVVSSALYSMLLTMQAQRLRRILALSTPPDMPLRDSAGRQITDSDLAIATEDQVIQLDAAGAEELKKLILEKLKERGKDVDASELELKAGEKSSDDD